MFLFMCVCVHVFMCMHMGEVVGCLGTPGAGVTGVCEPSGMGAMN